MLDKAKEQGSPVGAASGAIEALDKIALDKKRTEQTSFCSRRAEPLGRPFREQ